MKRYRDDVQNATGEQIAQAALDTVPDVWPLFWSFRIMVGVGFFYIAFFVVWFVKASRHRLDNSRALLKTAVWTLPLPWIAIEAGWLVAEYGRQPWVVEGVLPTYYAASGLSVLDLVISLTFFVTVYTTLAIIMAWLMIRVVRAGPTARMTAGTAGEIEPAPQPAE